MATQLDCSIGLAKEATFGTGVVPNRFLEFTSESLDRSASFVQGAGMRPGVRVARAGRRLLGREGAGGGITVEAGTKGLGVLLNAVMGTVTNTAVPSQTGAFQQVHTLSKSDPLDSFTIQKGIPTLAGTVTPLTFLGCQAKSLEITAKEGAILEVATDWTAREVVTTTAYAAPSYPADLSLFTFVHGQIMIGGTVTAPTATALATGGTVAANITEISLSIDNGLDEGGFNLGSAGKRTRKAVLGLAQVTGKLGIEYSDTVLRDAFLNQTQLALLLTFTAPQTIGVSVNPVLQIFAPAIFLEGELPKANGGDAITTAPSFTVLDPLAGEPITVVYRTSDTAI